MKKNPFADINSEVVLEKYIHNKPLRDKSYIVG